jgi:large subunit ribosomal protein L9
MKVLLIKDVYKLGRAGDVKKVADGFGRNFLLPQGLAVLATTGSIRQAETIRAKAAARRTVLNNELSGISELVNGLVIPFTSKAGETGKLYGSITHQMIADAINEKLGTKIDRRQIEVEPIRNLGDYKARIRLTVDLIPEVKILVHREGEVKAKPAAPVAPAAPAVPAAPETVPAAEPVEEEKAEE